MYQTKGLFTWEIENFSFWDKTSLQSPYLRIKRINKSVAHYLILYPKKEQGEDDDFVSCSLYTNRDENYECSYDIKMIGSTGEILRKIRSIDSNDGSEKNWWKVPKLLPIDEMFQNVETGKDVLTVCVTFCTDNDIENKIYEYTANTKICVDRLCFKLGVFYDFIKGSKVEKEIHIAPDRRFNFSLIGSLGSLRIIVSKLALQKLCLVDCRITIVEPLKPLEGSFKYITCCRHFFSVEASDFNWEFPSTTLNNELEINPKYTMFFNNGNQFSQIYCEFSCSSGTEISFLMPKNESNLFSSAIQTSVHLPSLKEDMLTLFSNKKFSDVKLRIDNRIVEAHKNVLATRSPVFDAMFSEDMTEASSVIVDIVDMDLNTLKLFLKYLYTDSVEEMNFETAADLLIAAEKFQVLVLKDKCSMFLKTKISVENVFDILSLSDAVYDESLRSAAMDFVIENSPRILQMPQWLVWMEKNMKLATTILSKISTKLSHLNN